MSKKSVLIYGEYSGYGKSLVKGFRGLGYKADVLGFSGDGFKKIESTIQLKGNNRLWKVFSLLKLTPTILSYKNILVINPEFFNFKFLGPIILALLKLTRKNIILLCCGDDVEFIRQGKKGNIENWPYMDIDLPRENYFSRKQDLFIHHLVASSAKKIIPVMYDYNKAWSLSKYKHKLTETISLACDGIISEIKPNTEKNKIVIMHGINRVDFKGTKIIKKALDKIKSKYNEQVEILLPENLPLAEYLNIMKNADISIDQTKGNSYGMNAIYSMYSGHIVLAPANDLFIENIQINECPIIKINNSVHSIVNQLTLLINSPEAHYDIKTKTQRYAQETHDPKIIATKIDKYLL